MSTEFEKLSNDELEYRIKMCNNNIRGHNHWTGHLDDLYIHEQLKMINELTRILDSRLPLN